jgi:hypothetical protein
MKKNTTLHLDALPPAIPGDQERHPLPWKSNTFRSNYNDLSISIIYHQEPTNRMAHYHFYFEFDATL